MILQVKRRQVRDVKDVEVLTDPAHRAVEVHVEASGLQGRPRTRTR